MVDIAHLIYPWNFPTSVVFITCFVAFHLVLVGWWKLGDFGWKVVDYVWLAFGLLSVGAAISNVRSMVAASNFETARNQSATLYRSFSIEIRSVADRCPDWRKRAAWHTDPNMDGHRGLYAEHIEGLCKWLTGEAERYPSVQPSDLKRLPWFPESADYASYSTKDDWPTDVDVDSLPDLKVIRHGIFFVENYTPDRGADALKKFEQLPAMAKRFNEHQTDVERMHKELERASFEDSNIRYAAPIFLALALALRMTKVTGEIALLYRKNKAARNK